MQEFEKIIFKKLSSTKQNQCTEESILYLSSTTNNTYT